MWAVLSATSGRPRLLLAWQVSGVDFAPVQLASFIGFWRNAAHCNIAVKRMASAGPLGIVGLTCLRVQARFGTAWCFTTGQSGEPSSILIALGTSRGSRHSQTTGVCHPARTKSLGLTDCRMRAWIRDVDLRISAYFCKNVRWRLSALHALFNAPASSDI